MPGPLAKLMKNFTSSFDQYSIFYSCCKCQEEGKFYKFYSFRDFKIQKQTFVNQGTVLLTEESEWRIQDVTTLKKKISSGNNTTLVLGFPKYKKQNLV